MTAPPPPPPKPAFDLSNLRRTSKATPESLSETFESAEAHVIYQTKLDAKGTADIIYKWDDGDARRSRLITDCYKAAATAEELALLLDQNRDEAKVERLVMTTLNTRVIDYWRRHFEKHAPDWKRPRPLKKYIPTHS